MILEWPDLEINLGFESRAVLKLWLNLIKL